MGSGHIHISKERNLKPLVLFIFFLLGLTMFCSYLTENRTKAGPAQNFYFIPSLKYISLAGATHKTFLGYLFFIRGILDLNQPFPASINRMDYLLANFKAAGTLEPELTRAFFFGGVVAVRNRQDAFKAIAFLQEGSQQRPKDWKFPFWIGLNYLQLGDYSRANEYYRKAAQLPGSPGYLKTNSVFFYYKTGEVDQGIAYLQSLILSLDDKRLIELIKFKLDWLKQLAELEEKVKEYYKLYGKYPRDLEELKNKKLILEIPADSFGQGFYLEKSADSALPRIKSRKIW